VHDEQKPLDATGWPHKNSGGVLRVINATRYSMAGLRAAWRHEIAFRQEVWIGIPLLCALPWIAPGRWQALLMALAVIAIWVVELLNSAIEAVADTITVEPHPLIERAKDLGSAAVLLTLIGAGLTWLVLLWPAV
jgi:diacylglycerol kinase (ATP)